jgi:hypothetical protein
MIVRNTQETKLLRCMIGCRQIQSDWALMDIRMKSFHQVLLDGRSIENIMKQY